MKKILSALTLFAATSALLVLPAYSQNNAAGKAVPAASTASPPAPVSAVRAYPDFVDLVEKANPAVVNIRTT